ncbi:Serine/threonine-protein kinase env7 [Coemansia brasiliensis]|uniref:non-specific serine/threonine protein kinase n=1 Tax=Coemansia brasiliensis TaxID=2650707 RepID=A0A9W8LWC3_9FUNG|nr:Serine/threonine-protein kinase env7 [Coemansia brasiliensis]
MLCHDGTDTLEMAQREIEAGKQLSHPNIVPLIGHLVGEHRAGARYVYMLFPLYKQGNLLDLSLRASELGEPLSEEFIIHVFRGICAALEYLHGYKSTQANAATEEANEQSAMLTTGDGTAGHTEDTTSDEQSQKRGEYTSVPQSSLDVDIKSTSSQYGLVHGDIKLGNVMLADDGRTPVLMDFGSVRPAHIKAQTRMQALQIQDDAAQRCTMPYRAPELFDVQRGAEFDTRTDVWALGCLLFALAYGFTPFEDPHEGPGASIALAAANARYRVPESSPYSKRIPQLVAYMLEPDPQTRPFIDQVIAQINSLYQ